MSSADDGVSDRAARYLARRGEYVWVGQLRRRDRTALWNALCGLLWARYGRNLPMQNEDPAHPPVAAAPRDRLMTHLREVVNRLFVSLDDTPEEMNLIEAAWTHMPWGGLVPLDVLPVAHMRRIGAQVRHGPHTIRLYMLWRPENAPRPQVTQITYYGPQRFHTVQPSNEWVDQEVDDLGCLDEVNIMLDAPDPADISDLRAAASDTDKEQLDQWRCTICSEGIEDDKFLEAAHAPFVDPHGNHVMHVLHRKCLQNLRKSAGSWSKFCPTCKQPLQARALPQVWKPQHTVLNARMGVAMPDPNPYTLNANYTAAKPLRNSSSWNEIRAREPGIADLILRYSGRAR